MGDLSRHFSRSELACSHCGELGPWGLKSNLNRLETLRLYFSRPMPINSGHRCAEHPIEAAKDEPGAHTTGLGIDVAVQGEDAIRLTIHAFTLDWQGVGWQQKGSGRYVHLDRAEARPNAPRPHAWTY